MLSRALWDSGPWRSFCPPFLVGRALGLHDLLWVPKGRTVANQSSSNKTTWDRDSSRLEDEPPRTLQKKKYKTVTTLILITYSAWLYSLLTGGGWRGGVVGHSSWDASRLCSPFAWQSNKASLSFSSITVSVFLFGTRMQTAKILMTNL